MRLIDADEFKRVAAGCVFETPKGIRIKAEIAIDARPAVDAEPVRRGRWLSYTGTHYTGKENEYGDPEYKEHIFFVCSNCRRKTVVREHFCPNCGRDMRVTDTNAGEKGGADNG